MERRWQQRFENFEKALRLLRDGIATHPYSDLEMAGLIQFFEFTFELGWKALQDLLKEKGAPQPFPRDVIKAAFQAGLINDGELWLKMMEERSVMSHTYDEVKAAAAVELIIKDFYPAFSELYATLQSLQ